MEEEKQVTRIPNLEVQQWAFECSLPDSLVSNKAAVKAKIIDAITKNDMAPYYVYLTEKLKWPVDAELLSKLRAANESKMKEFETKLAAAFEQEGESEVRDIMEEEANYYCQIGDKERAVSHYRLTNEKTIGLGGKIDIVFAQIRLGLFYDDKDLVRRNIEKANSLVEQGGDWDRRNRLKVYEGLFHITQRDFKSAAKRLLESVATFTSTEMLDFKDFVFYTVAASLMALDRLALKKQVVNSPEILSVLDELPHVRDLLNSFYNCNYRLFLRALMHVYDQLQRDRLFSKHASFFAQEMRIKGYTQFLDSYKSVTLASMAKAFGMSIDVLDLELSRFIASARLNCKIDKVNGVIATTRPDTRNAQYMETIKSGDALLHRMQKLSRVINV